MGRSAETGLKAASVIILLGFAATILIISSANLKVESIGLIQIGVGPEDLNDQAVAEALGEPVQANSTEPEVNDAVNATAEAVAAEIDAAVEKGANDGEAAWEASIEKFKGQEASMGHSGWIQSWAHARRNSGLKNWRRSGATVQQLATVDKR